jgi:hypothetical protein
MEHTSFGEWPDEREIACIEKFGSLVFRDAR